MEFIEQAKETYATLTNLNSDAEHHTYGREVSSCHAANNALFSAAKDGALSEVLSLVMRQHQNFRIQSRLQKVLYLNTRARCGSRL